MTEPENQSKQTNSRAELSRARQRRLKRDGQASDATQAEAGTARRRTASQRAATRKGPSTRERLVAARVKLTGEAAPSIQEKLTSKLSRIAQPPEEEHRQQKAPASRSPRRKPASPRIELNYEATPRAETQRKSRNDGPVIPRKSRRTFDAHSEASPPVMVRGGMGGMAFGRVATSKLSKQKAPRRRYDVPLRVQGAEVRLPSMPLVHLGWRAASLVLVVMTIACLFMMWKAPVFQVRSVEAEGIKRLTLADVNAVIRTTGSSVFSLDPKVLENNLQQAFPEFSSIKVRVNLPANVKVVVTERNPVIAWTQEGNEVWLDTEGVAFPPRGVPEAVLVKVTGYGTPPNVLTEAEETEDTPSFLPGFPYTQGKAFPSMRLDPKMVAAILALGSKLPPDTVVIYDSERGMGWNDPAGWEVFFGEEDQDMEMKLMVYQTLVERLQSQGIQPELISVEYVHAPYYRMER